MVCRVILITAFLPIFLQLPPSVKFLNYLNFFQQPTSENNYTQPHLMLQEHKSAAAALLTTTSLFDCAFLNSNEHEKNDEKSSKQKAVNLSKKKLERC